MTQEKIMWGRVALAVIVIVVVAAVGAFLVLRRGPAQEGQGPAEEEYAWVQYTASFKLLNTEDNGPVENLRVEFPYPHIAPAPNQMENAAPYENLGTIDLFVRPHNENVAIYFSPVNHIENRLAPLFTPVWIWTENWVRVYCPGEASKLAIPKFALQVSQLYPGDEFTITAWLKIPEENLGKITLTDSYVNNLPLVFIYQFFPETTIGVTIETNMIKQLNEELLESWMSKINENASWNTVIKLYEKI